MFKRLYLKYLPIPFHTLSLASHSRKILLLQSVQLRHVASESKAQTLMYLLGTSTVSVCLEAPKRVLNRTPLHPAPITCFHSLGICHRPLLSTVTVFRVLPTLHDFDLSAMIGRSAQGLLLLSSPYSGCPPAKKASMQFHRMIPIRCIVQFTRPINEQTRCGMAAMFDATIVSLQVQCLSLISTT